MRQRWVLAAMLAVYGTARAGVDEIDRTRKEVDAAVQSLTARTGALVEAAREILEWNQALQAAVQKKAGEVKDLEQSWAGSLLALKRLQDKVEKSGVTDDDLDARRILRRSLAATKQDVGEALSAQTLPGDGAVQAALRKASGEEPAALTRLCESLRANATQQLRDLAKRKETAEVLTWPEKGTARSRIDRIESEMWKKTNAATRELQALEKQLAGLDREIAEGTALLRDYEKELQSKQAAAGGADSRTQAEAVARLRADLDARLAKIRSSAKQLPPPEDLPLAKLKAGEYGKYVTALESDYVKDRTALLDGITRAEKGLEEIQRVEAVAAKARDQDLPGRLVKAQLLWRQYEALRPRLAETLEEVAAKGDPAAFELAEKNALVMLNHHLSNLLDDLGIPPTVKKMGFSTLQPTPLVEAIQARYQADRATNAAFGRKAKDAIKAGVPVQKRSADFEASGIFYRTTDGKVFSVEITYTGCRESDNDAADDEARKKGLRKRPDNYSWHHLDDYDENTNRGTLQLVRKSSHASVSHAGGVHQWRKCWRKEYKSPCWKPGPEELKNPCESN